MQRWHSWRAGVAPQKSHLRMNGSISMARAFPPATRDSLIVLATSKDVT
jgi:hypothetical protein